MNLEEILLSKFREETNASKEHLSDRTILDTIKAYGLPENDEESIKEYVEKHTPVFKTFAGQTRAVLSSTIEKKEKELKDLEQKYKETVGDDKGDPHNNDEPTKSEQPNEDMSEITKLRKELEEIKNGYKDLITKSTKESILGELKSHAEKIGLTDEYVLNNSINKIDISNTENIDELKSTLKDTYYSEFKACRGVDAPDAGGGSLNDETDSYLKSMFKKKFESEKKFNKNLTK